MIRHHIGGEMAQAITQSEMAVKIGYGPGAMTRELRT